MLLAQVRLVEDMLKVFLQGRGTSCSVIRVGTRCSASPTASSQNGFRGSRVLQGSVSD
jgi:hypothetical protein